MNNKVDREEPRTMTETKFRHEMARAEAMRAVEPDRADYWTGYVRGLRRAYHGEKFGTEAEHRQWFTLVGDPDHDRAERGWGYADGLRAAPAPDPDLQEAFDRERNRA